jgi:hypothetical protein
MPSDIFLNLPLFCPYLTIFANIFQYLPKITDTFRHLQIPCDILRSQDSYENPCDCSRSTSQYHLLIISHAQYSKIMESSYIDGYA